MKGEGGPKAAPGAPAKDAHGECNRGLSAVARIHTAGRVIRLWDEEFDALDWPTDYDEAMAHAVRLGLLTASGGATDRCQCPTCGQVFSTEANFDRHLSPDRQAEDFAGKWCRDPATVDLIRSGIVWHRPGPPEPHSALREKSGADPQAGGGV